MNVINSMYAEFIKTKKSGLYLKETGHIQLSTIAQNRVWKPPVMDDTHAWRLALFEELSGSIAEDIL